MALLVPRSGTPSSPDTTRHHQLDQVWAKVERAEKHILDFTREGRIFLESNPYSLAHNVDPNTGEDTLFYKDIKLPPREFSLMIGDAIHNLRSALDLLACQLVRLNAITHDCSNIEFPIKNSSQQLEAAFKKREIKLLGQSAIQIIRRLEPFQGGKGNELWQLHQLDIQDKHRLLIVAPTGIERFRLIFTLNPPNISDLPSTFEVEVLNFDVPVGGELTIPKNGDPIIVLPPNRQTNVNGKFTIDIAFDESQIIKRQSVLYTLVMFVDIVKDTVKQFELFFS